MNTCDPYVLSQYLDRELDLAAHREVEQHLRSCSVCRDELRSLRRMDRVLVTWGVRRRPLPIETEKRILRAVEGRRRPRRALALSRMMPAAVGSSIAALLVLMSANFARFDQQAPSPTSSAYTSAMQRTINQQEQPLVASRRTSAILGGPGMMRMQVQPQPHMSPRLD